MHSFTIRGLEQATQLEASETQKRPRFKSAGVWLNHLKLNHLKRFVYLSVGVTITTPASRNWPPPVW